MNVTYDPVTGALPFGKIKRECEDSGSNYAIITHPTLDGFLVMLSKRAVNHLRVQDGQWFDKADGINVCTNQPLFSTMFTHAFPIWGQVFSIPTDWNWLLLGVNSNARIAKVEAELTAAISYNSVINLTVDIN